MRRTRLGKFILTFVLVVGAVVSTAVDWNRTHLFNPAWHPHARFHDALFLALLDGTTLIMLWLLWRPSREPAVAVAATALYLLAVWTPFLYIEALIHQPAGVGRRAGPQVRRHEPAAEPRRRHRGRAAVAGRLVAGPRRRARCVGPRLQSGGHFCWRS
jgi:hypothetical protein